MAARVQTRARRLAAQRVAPRSELVGQPVAGNGESHACLRHLPHVGRTGVEPLSGHEEELRDDFRAQVASSKHPHDRALRDDHRDRVGRPRDRRGGGVARSKPREEILGSRDVDVDEPSRRDERAVVLEEKGAVELGELLDGLSKLGSVDPEEPLGCP